MKVARIVVICALLLWFTPAAIALAQAAGIDLDDEQKVGTVDQYNRDGWDFEDPEFQVPLIGLSVRNSLGKLASGQSVRGLGVIAVKDASAAAVAGVHGERAALRSTLVGAFFAGAMIFPPAMFGAVLVEESGLGQPRDIIIAVDGTRTRDVIEFENAISRADVGEIIYLTILRDGCRKQLRLTVDADSSPRQ